MLTSRLGGSALSVSRVGLGCNAFGARIDAQASRAVVAAALDAGITFFDTSDNYGDGESERIVGAALRDRRADVVIATKFGSKRGGARYGVPRGSPTHARRSLEDSLARLGTDHVDLLYYHMHDGETPIAETLGAMQDLVEEGKACAIACANFDAELLAEADAAARDSGRTGLCALQHNYSLLERGAEEALLPLCEELGIGFVPYWPLAFGLLTGKYRRDVPPPPGTRLGSGDTTVPGFPDSWWDRLDALQAFAADHDRTLLELAIAGLASQPAVVSVIAGATTPEQVRANAAAGDWQLSDAERRELDGLAAAA